VQKGLLTAREQGPTPERGGRRKRLYRCTAMGLRALREVKRVEQAVWSGLPDGISSKLGLA
jgi:DNA-binding PadR family transcriptional regulator